MNTSSMPQDEYKRYTDGLARGEHRPNPELVAMTGQRDQAVAGWKDANARADIAERKHRAALVVGLAFNAVMSLACGVFAMLYFLK